MRLVAEGKGNNREERCEGRGVCGMLESLKKITSCSVREVEFARGGWINVVSKYLVDFFSERLDVVYGAKISHTIQNSKMDTLTYSKDFAESRFRTRVEASGWRNFSVNSPRKKIDVHPEDIVESVA